MLSRMPYVIVGFVIASALFVSLAVFAQSPLANRVQPAVIDIHQDVPVVAEIDGASVPFTVGVSLQVALSGPVTASIAAAPAPVVNVVTGTEMVDALGIPFTLSIDGDGLEITEWTAFINKYEQFEITGESYLADDAPEAKEAIALIRFYDKAGELTDVSEFYATIFHPGTHTRFSVGTTLRALQESNRQLCR